MQQLDYSEIGKRIRQVRKAKKWSQGALAEKCGISMSFLGHIERGTRIMSLDTFISICEALGTGTDELLWGIPNPDDSRLRDMWNGTDTGNMDAYIMYTRIMKSVAKIISGV